MAPMFGRNIREHRDPAIVFGLTCGVWHEKRFAGQNIELAVSRRFRFRIEFSYACETRARGFERR
jgi:hypothetical protein